MKRRCFGVFIAILCSFMLRAQGVAIVQADPSFVSVSDDPSLPRVLLIGDSISMGYTIPTRRLLAGRANVHRIPANGGSTEVGMANLEKWLGKGKWDVIHFNWGLHDLTVLKDGSYLVSLDRYGKNLLELVKKLKGTGATLVWATTTPVPDADIAVLHRRTNDAIAYNRVAREIIENNGIVIDDLYAFALPRLTKVQIPNNVHFTDGGSEELAKQAADKILTALKTRNRPNVSATPARRTDSFWVDRNNVINERARRRNVDLVFIGDSITHRWEENGKETWDKYYSWRRAMNAGIDGDATQFAGQTYAESEFCRRANRAHRSFLGAIRPGRPDIQPIQFGNRPQWGAHRRKKVGAGPLAPSRVRLGLRSGKMPCYGRWPPNCIPPPDQGGGSRSVLPQSGLNSFGNG